MRILIEEYQYEVSDVKDVLHGIDPLTNIEGKVSIHYVGYYYNSKLKDCVFILPKVLLDEHENVFGNHRREGILRPEDIINLNESNALSQKEKDFIYKFAVWIYRAIVVYKNNKDNDTTIVYHQNIAQVGKGQRRLSNTYLDILLSLIQFNHDNRNFFFFILRNLHSGYNKINWTRTIGTMSAIVKDNRPIYLNPVNKKRQVDFDEELLVMFFSILNYIGDTYGFAKEIDCHFQLIKGKQFETYLKGFGITRLLQIKYKYFSDKALELWRLCYAFFDESRQVYINTEQKEYLLVKSFYIVFEAIIDELIGDNPLPDDMKKKQEDGKVVDHLFTAASLMVYDKKKLTYYIGDSKYYKIGHELGTESIYKQYTYARNVIQWNLDIFNNNEMPESGIRLRDDITEGYNIIPNFFISAKMDNENFDYSDDGIEKTDRDHNKHSRRQFENRLFDRDTLLLFHYDVNFLFVLSLYARNNNSQKASWKQRIREMFRKDIQEWLQKYYDFYAMHAHPGVDGEAYIKEHFQEILGKMYAPFTNQNIYSLALDRNDKYKEDNDTLRDELSKYFYVVSCKLGENPEALIEQEAMTAISTSGEQDVKNGVLLIMMEQYKNRSVQFLPDGKLAVAIKYSKDSMEIAKNLSSIGYVLFHVRSNKKDKHLYAVKGKCKIMSADELEPDIYRNIKGNNETMYVYVELDTITELDSSNLFPNNKLFTPKTRYDAQFATISELREPKKDLG